MKRFLAVIILLVLVSVMTSCDRGGGSDSIDEHYKFGATYMTLNNPFFVTLNNGIKDVVEANGDILIALDPALDPNKQVSQIEDLIAQEVDAIFVNPADWKAIRPALEAAQEAGIPVINVDSPVYDTDLVASVISSDNYNAGVLCAQDMMEKLDSARIVILEHPTAKSSIDRIQGFIDTIEGVEGYEIVARQSSDGELEQAMQVMEIILLAIPEFDVIMALNDPTAMGALAAIQASNQEDDILIYGVDGAPEAKQMIYDRQLTASAAQSPITIGKTAAGVAYDLLEGKDVEKEILVDVVLIDQDNIDEYGTTAWQ